MDANQDARIFVPPTFSTAGKGRNPGLEIVPAPRRLHENVFSTGELDGIEQSLGVVTEKEVVLVVGCSHPEMRYSLDKAQKFGEIYGIIGGLHGFSKYDLFEDLELICPTHCTQHKAELKKKYPEKYVRGGAGRIIEI